MGITVIHIMTFYALIEDYVVSFVHPGAVDSQSSKATDYHLRMFVASKICKIAYYTPIDVSFIVKDSPTTRSPANKVYIA